MTVQAENLIKALPQVKRRTGFAGAVRLDCVSLRRAGNGQTGFTLVELVMVMVIIGIVSATVLPKFTDNSIFQSRGFADQVLATLRYAQKAAIAQHRLVCVNLANTTPATVTLTIAGLSSATDCNVVVPLNLPDRANNTLTAPTGITLAATSSAFTFDALGRASTTVVITIPGAAAAITVVAETGYVHQ